MKRDIIRNENTMGITVISETKTYDQEHIDNYWNDILGSDKYIEP